MRWSRWNWQTLFSYAEVMCFVSAWAVTLLMAYSMQRPVDDRTATRSFASSSDVSGLQAELRLRR